MVYKSTVNKRLFFYSILISLLLLLLNGYFFPVKRYFSCEVGINGRGVVFIELRKYLYGYAYSLNDFSISQCFKNGISSTDSLSSVYCSRVLGGKLDKIEFDYAIGRILIIDDDYLPNYFPICKRLAPADN